MVLGITITSDYPGSIPDVIADLKHLEILRFHKNPFLVGEIPPAIGQLSKGDISWTNISGHIPAFLANLKNLQFLDLHLITYLAQSHLRLEHFLNSSP